MIEFQARVRQSGIANIITVPIQYVKDGHIRVGKLYRFVADEVNPDAEQPPQE